MNQEDKRKVKIGIAISAFAIVLLFALINIDNWGKWFSLITSIISPIIYGICFAFVINIVLRLLETKVFKRLDKKPIWKKLRRPVCLSLSIILILGIIAAIVAFIMPQLVESCATLVDRVPKYIKDATALLDNTLKSFGLDSDLITTISQFFANFSDKIISYITTLVPQLANTAVQFTSGIINIFMGFVLGVYMASMKETLIKSCKKAVYAFMPKSKAEYTRHVYRLINDRFTGFVSGQITEAFILGTLCAVGMKIFRMDYALLIGVIVGATNIIPMFGAWIGGIVGGLITLMISPMQALWLIIFLVVLQQLESNLIYPRVVGSSIGLSGLWVLFSVIVGGALFGFAGIVLGVPAFAVIYTLISETVEKRLRKRNLDAALS